MQGTPTQRLSCTGYNPADGKADPISYSFGYRQGLHSVWAHKAGWILLELTLRAANSGDFLEALTLFGSLIAFSTESLAGESEMNLF